MSKTAFYYFIEIGYLGYRYHGWQKQPGLKTVQGMMEKTLGFVLGHKEFKTLGASRTDAMVSAKHAAFELFTREPIDTQWLLHQMQENVPADIQVYNCRAIDRHFNIIQHPTEKEYHYHFTFGKPNSPLAAPYTANFKEELDIEAMMSAASVFIGRHNFKQYCCKPSPDKQFVRSIKESKIEQMTINQPFVDKTCYKYKVVGEGFMRYQVRLMMTKLVDVGAGRVTRDQIQASLRLPEENNQTRIAPASGLVLERINFIAIDTHFVEQ